MEVGSAEDSAEDSAGADGLQPEEPATAPDPGLAPALLLRYAVTTIERDVTDGQSEIIKVII